MGLNWNLHKGGGGGGVQTKKKTSTGGVWIFFWNNTFNKSESCLIYSNC